MARILPISEVKARLPELVVGVLEREEEIVVTRNGRPAAMLVNVDEYARLKETLDVLSDPDLMRQASQPDAKPFTVDLASQTINGSVHFDVAPRKRKMLLEGLDEIGLTLAMEPKIAAFQAADRAKRPWIYSP